MPAWVAVLGALAGVLASLLMAQVFGGPDEADKPLATLRAEGFSVRMPGNPERSEDPIAIPVVGPAKDLVGPTTAITYTSESDDKAFAVSVMEGPTTVAFERDAGIEGWAGGVGGTLRHSSKSRYRGHPAIDGAVDGVADGKATAFVRIVHAGRRVFVLQAIVDGSAEAPPPTFADMLASLRIGARRPTPGRDPLVARRIPTDAPAGVAAGLAQCRRQATGKAVSDGVRRTVQRVCADAEAEDLAGVEAATLAACVAVARETGELERCGFEIVSP